MRLTSTFRAPKRSSLVQVVKSAVATAAAWLLAAWLIQGPPPVFAAIAALLVVQPSLNQSFARAIERSVGVIAGVVIASLLGLAFGNSTWVILVAATAGLLLAWVLKMTPGTTNQVAISAVLVLALAATTPGYAVDRILETLLGAAIGFVVNIAIVPPVAISEARTTVDALGRELGATFERLAVALETPQTPERLPGLLVEARLLRTMRQKAEDALAAGSESLTLNPRGGRHRTELAALQRRLDLFTPMITQAIGMTRAVVDGYSPTLSTDPNVRAIAEQLRRAAHDTELVAGGEDVAAEPAALTRPLYIPRPSEAHWVLIGSLLEDLHRVHQTLQDGIEDPAAP